MTPPSGSTPDPQEAAVPTTDGRGDALRRLRPARSRMQVAVATRLTTLGELELRAYWPDENPEPMWAVMRVGGVPWLRPDDLRWLREQIDAQLAALEKGA